MPKRSNNYIFNRLGLDHILIDRYVSINIYWILPNMDLSTLLGLVTKMDLSLTLLVFVE